ncbi:TIGR03943 family protein [Fictibacillus sp. Mic-4]|uniref:TIGR03943 family putative permease subunit n=1 Tax=Fictibacillus sp. Mic-4 TaxID=3132826 RepID=UPI003CF871CD
MKNEQDWEFHTYIRAIILFGFMLLLFAFIVSGKINSYVSPRMVPFSYMAMIGFGLLGAVQMFRGTAKNTEEEMNCGCGIDHRPKGSPLAQFSLYLIFVIPVLAGLMIPEAALDTSVAKNRGVKYGSGIYSKPSPPKMENEKSNAFKIDADEYLKDPDGYIKKMEKNAAKQAGVDESAAGSDDARAYYASLVNTLARTNKIIVTPNNFMEVMAAMDHDIRPFVGKQMEISGFVYRESGFKADQAVVARFAVECCIADASVYGVLMSSKDMKAYQDDAWIKATGVITKSVYNKHPIPLMKVQHLTRIKEPKDPYVYPDM